MLPMENRIDKLNLLRVITFLCIFLRHAKFFMPVPWNEVTGAWLLYTPAWAGVWIFFILSGYGIGAGFYSEKYSPSINGIMQYYIKRLGKIVPLYWFYLFVVALFITPGILMPTREHIDQLLSLFFFNYQEEFASLQFGLAWYLTTLVRLYFLAPFFFIIAKRWITTSKRTILAICILIITGFLARVGMGYHISLTDGLVWEEDIYKPFYFNLDMFYTGFLLSALKKQQNRRRPSFIWKAGIFILLIEVLVYNSRIYYYGSILGVPNLMEIYEYILPTVYIVVVCGCIYIFDVMQDPRYSPVDLTALKGNPARVVDLFPRIQFPMYLFHSTVLLCMLNGYDDALFSYYTDILHVAEPYRNFAKSCLFTAEAFFFSLLLAVTVSCLFRTKGESPLMRKLMDFPYDDVAHKIKQIIIGGLRKLFPLHNTES